MTRDEAIFKANYHLTEAEAMLPSDPQQADWVRWSIAYSSLAAVLPVETTRGEEASVPTGMKEEPRDYVQELIDYVSNHPDCKLENYRYSFYFRGSELVALDKRNDYAQGLAREWLEILKALEGVK